MSALPLTDVAAKGRQISHREVLQAKLANMIVDEVSFEDATFKTALKYIRHKSKELDPEGVGINIVVICDRRVLKTTLTLELEDVPMSALLRYVCMAGGVTYHVDNHAVVIKNIEKK